MRRARHIEVQILGDGTGAIAHLGERECSIQRRYQKIVEIAPAPALDEAIRSAILDAAVKLAASVDYANGGTFEFLLDVSGDEAGRFAFIEANARLQVEHTVTEAVTGIDIVQTQLRLAGGETLADLGLDDPSLATPRGFAIQARVNMETVAADGTIRPSSGTLAVYEAPSGPGVRTDGFGYAGYTISPRYDSLLAKVIGHAPSARFADAVARTSRALSEFRIEGVTTNIPLLQNILAHEDFAAGRVHTRFVDEHLEELAAADASPRSRFVEPAADEAEADARESGFAGAQVDQSDPLGQCQISGRVDP